MTTSEVIRHLIRRNDRITSGSPGGSPDPQTPDHLGSPRIASTSNRRFTCGLI